MNRKTRVALAFQGGGFPAGAVGAGVVKYLVEQSAFERYDIDVFSGSSSGALVAAACWGHKLRGTIEEAPETLKRQWMHFAWGMIPNAQVARTEQLLDSMSRLNPLYDAYSENIVVPFLRFLMKEWVLAYIPVEELIALRVKKGADVPGLALGAADVLTGNGKVFSEQDFSLETLLASGSLDEVNGLTTIASGAHQGTYCDGAWGPDPPLTPLIDYGIDEIWLVQHSALQRSSHPQSPAERKERKNELDRCRLVEQELQFIAKVNDWLRTGQLKNEAGKYRPITVKTMPARADLPTGSAFVNSPSFIEEMMAYGYSNARVFLDP
jgi:NTE family protein